MRVLRPDNSRIARRDACSTPSIASRADCVTPHHFASPLRRLRRLPLVIRRITRPIASCTPASADAARCANLCQRCMLCTNKRDRPPPITNSTRDIASAAACASRSRAFAAAASSARIVSMLPCH